MSFLKKLVTQLKGVSNDLLDEYSNAGRTARQTIRDIEIEIKAAEESITSVLADLKYLEIRLEDAKKQAAEWHSLSIQANARQDKIGTNEAVNKEVQAEELITTYSQQVERLKPMVNQLKGRLSDLRNKKETISHEADLLNAREGIASTEIRVAKLLGNVGKSKVAVDFDALNKQVEKKESKAQAYSELANEKSMSSDDKHMIIIQRNEAVQKKLNSLKQL